jgi:hypothetical protein
LKNSLIVVAEVCDLGVVRKYADPTGLTEAGYNFSMGC